MIARLRALAARVAGLLRRRPDAGFDDEMRTHLQLLTERYIRQGLAPADAASAARRQFGNLTLLQEDRREMQTVLALEHVWRSFRYSVRQLRITPGFTAAAILSLALGIGANTAVFTLLDQLVLRLLPVPSPERLVMIWSTGPNLGDTRGVRASSFPLCQTYQRKADAFDSVFCRYSTAAAITVDDSTEPVTVELVSGNYFDALHVGPSAGRVFSMTADDRIDRGHPVVVISFRYWVDRLGHRPDIVGKKILVNGNPMEVVGIASAGFNGMDPAQAPQIWLPLRMKALMTPEEDGLNDPHYDFVQVFARLKTGYTVESARASLQPLFHQLLEAEVTDAQIGGHSAYDRDLFLKRRVLVERAATGYSEMRQQYSMALVVLMAMAGLILLIACSNVASLLIARAVARQREMSVRLAIGASRGTLIGQLLIESLLLAVTGAALGLVLSVVAARTLIAMLPSSDALLMLHAEPDLRILAFSIVASFVTAVLFGVAPALHATGFDVLATLKDESGGVTGAVRSSRLRKILVGAQIALSFLLLIGAGLFSRTLTHLKHTDTGIRSIENLIAFGVNPAKSGYTVPQLRRFYGDLLDRIRATPGVESAAYTWIPLLQGWAPGWHMRVEGYSASDGEDMEIQNNIVSPGYWQTMGVRLDEGRDFDERDRFDPADVGKEPTVAIVNRRFAERFFGTRSAIGRRIGAGEHAGALGVRIVGVVEDSLYAGPRTGLQPSAFFSFTQANFPVEATFYIRARTESAALFPVLRKVVAGIDRSIPIYGMKTVERQLDDTLSSERLIASLSAVFAALATTMAALGLYGVMSFVVARRTREIGLRIALGAAASTVVRMVMGEIAILAGSGLLVGLPCAYGLSRLASSQLLDMPAVDGVTAGAAALVLVTVAAISGFVPARRACAIEPLKALRHE
jgi:predicted permease